MSILNCTRRVASRRFQAQSFQLCWLAIWLAADDVDDTLVHKIIFMNVIIDSLIDTQVLSECAVRTISVHMKSAEMHATHVPKGNPCVWWKGDRGTERDEENMVCDCHTVFGCASILLQTNNSRGREQNKKKLFNDAEECGSQLNTIQLD